jgi:hypothetical protein
MRFTPVSQQTPGLGAFIEVSVDAVVVSLVAVSEGKLAEFGNILRRDSVAIFFAIKKVLWGRFFPNAYKFSFETFYCNLSIFKNIFRCDTWLH